jgi:hypothetical protein
MIAALHFLELGNILISITRMWAPRSNRFLLATDPAITLAFAAEFIGHIYVHIFIIFTPATILGGV